MPMTVFVFQAHMDSHCESTLTLQLAGRTESDFGCVADPFAFWTQTHLEVQFII